MSKGGEPEEGRMRKGALARALSISRPTLDRYMALADAPAPDKELTYDVEQVAGFIAKVKQDEQPVKNKSFWEAERIRLQCEKIAHGLAVQRGEFISRQEASQTLVPLMAELGQLLRQEFELVNPSRYQGKDRVECAQINIKSIDLVVRRFRSGVKDMLTEEGDK